MNVSAAEFTRLADVAVSAGIPRHMVQEVVAYCLAGRPAGEFLSRIIANDLMGACQHADYINKPHLHRFAEFFLLHAPEGSFGSSEVYGKWLKQRGLLGQSPSATSAPAPPNK